MFERVKNLAGIANDFRGQVAAVRGNLDRARRRRAELLTAPLTREDTIAVLCEHIDHCAEQYPALLAASIDGLVKEPDCLKADTLPRVREWVRGGLAAPVGGQPVSSSYLNPKSLECGLYYVFRNEFKKAVAAAVNARPDWPQNAGPSRRSREAELAKLDAEIPGLEAQVKALEEERQRLMKTFEE